MNYGLQRNLSLDFLNTCPEFIIGVYFKSNATGHGSVIAEAGAIGRLTSTVLKSSARKEIMNDGELKDGNISAESSVFRRRIADQQGSFSVLYLF